MNVSTSGERGTSANDASFGRDERVGKDCPRDDVYGL